MTIWIRLARLFLNHDQSGIERDLRVWRKRIGDALFYLFSVLGFFTYVPSVYMSIREGLYPLAAFTTVLYLTCIALTMLKRIHYFTRAIIGSVLFFAIGLMLLFVLGPRGPGNIWLFSTTLLMALLLGNGGALVVFCANVFTQAVFYFLLRTGELSWQELYGIYPYDWLISAINFTLLNFVILLGIAIFSKGFKSLMTRSIETRNATIIGLAKLAEHRDNDTGIHLQRIQGYAKLITEELSLYAPYREYITEEYTEDLRVSSILHDIGKVGIPDAILLKPGKLSSDEFTVIKQHPKIGADVITEIEKNINGESLYTLGKEIALHHHERWDGTGYPMGLSGAEIPLSARITALADVYDALTSKRVYKDPVGHRDALNIIREGRGTQFDPDIVDAFLRVADRIVRMDGD